MGMFLDATITNNHEFSQEHSMVNRIVYAQLLVVTSDGTSHHLVKQYDHNKDGHRAWQALSERHDGDLIKNENAEIVRNSQSKTGWS